jgi:NAD(P)-dependent dehydrogenase (short-subunit alcohol dehydrogenase family)
MMHLFRKHEPISVAGARVLVTGAGRGIGLATATRLVASGARVGLGDLDADTAHAAARSLGERAFSAHLDVRDPASFAAFVAEGEARMGAIDVLVAANGAWAIVCFVLAAALGSRSTALGAAVLVFEGMFVGGLALLERKHLRPLLT